MVKPKQKRRSAAASLLVLLLIFGIGAGTWQRYDRPLFLTSSSTFKILPTTTPKLSWPNYGQAAIGSPGFGVLASSANQKSQPMASLAKVMTALMVLKVKPLKINETGPIITIDQTSIDYYHYYADQGGSILPVNLGEQISEYHALQAVLLPSANNMADTLARWAFGSLEKYNIAANQMAVSIGMSSTQIDSASGFTVSTTASANDMVTLGITAMQNPVLAKIVDQSTADIEVAGTVNNVNFLLGTNNIDGIKTGNTDEAGGCYLFSAHAVVDNLPVRLIGVVMGAPTLFKAMQDSLPLLSSGLTGFKKVDVLIKDSTVGLYNAPWDASSPIVANQNLSVINWGSQPINSQIKISNKSGALVAGNTAGTAIFKVAGKNLEVPLKTSEDIPPPSWWWRITHK